MADFGFSSLLYPNGNVRKEEGYTRRLRHFGVENHRVEAFMYNCEIQLDDPLNEYNGEIQDIEKTKDNMIATMMNGKSTKQVLVMIELMYSCLKKRRTHYIACIEEYVLVINIEGNGNAEAREFLTTSKKILKYLIKSCPDFNFLKYLMKALTVYKESPEDFYHFLRLFRKRFDEQSSFAGTTN